MALAYAVVLVANDLYKNQKRDTVAAAQHAADEKFRKVAEEARCTKVTRNPEPREMTIDECRNLFPQSNLEGLTGLYFTADIS